MRPTRAGIGLVCATAICFSVGRIFGLPEFFLLTGICVASLAVACLSTLTSRLHLSVDRVATPSRLRVGAPARVDLRVTNQARWRSPVLGLQDRVQNGSGASLTLAPVPPGGHTSIAYRLPTRERGHLSIGPLDVTIGDALGLTSSTVRASGQISLVVHAELVDLGVLHATAGFDPTAEQQSLRSLASSGDEFFALRPYVVGDDLRRVNWRASARTGELVVRQEERSQTGRVTVLLDTRTGSYTSEGFERAVSSALSILYAGWKGDDALRYLTSGSGTFADIRSRAELDAVDEQLALIQPTDSASLVRTIDETARVGRGGTLIVITGRPTAELRGALDGAARRYSSLLSVMCEPPDAQIPPTELGTTIYFDGHTTLNELWQQHVLRQSLLGSR